MHCLSKKGFRKRTFRLHGEKGKKKKKKKREIDAQIKTKVVCGMRKSNGSNGPGMTASTGMTKKKNDDKWYSIEKRRAPDKALKR